MSKVGYGNSHKGYYRKREKKERKKKRKEREKRKERKKRKEKRKAYGQGVIVVKLLLRKEEGAIET